MNDHESISVSFDEGRNRADIAYSIGIMPIVFIYFEILLHASTGLEWSRAGWMYTLLFAFIAGPALYLVSTIFSYKINRIILVSIVSVLALIYSIYEVYFSFFSSFIDLSVAGEAGNMINDFLGNIISCTISNLHWIVAFFLPTVVLVILTHKTIRIVRSYKSLRIMIAAFMLLVAFIRTGLITVNNSEYDDKFYYRDGYDVTIAASRFGLPTAIRLNIQYTLFGKPEAELTPPANTEDVDIDQLFGTTPPSTSVGDGTTEEPEAPFVPIDAVLDINFEELARNETNNTIRSMHQYFASVAPTQTNKYTGMFEGKNLIYITAEGFSDKVIDPTLTPTLYKMSTQGFVFNNCYNGLWGGSTATGEYLSINGIFYNSAGCLKTSGGGGSDGKARLMYYALGNTFGREGYLTYAFHNHNPNYYGRNFSHPNFGFNFIGANGTYSDFNYTGGITYPTNSWPKSDLEMAQLSTSYYIGSEPFCAYYMTVSGHANYNWSGNAMCKRHRGDVADLPYSEEVKAYIACNLELELMLEELVAQLEAKGILEDTVFVISSDHYPYALSEASLAELYGLPASGITENFDLYRNKFIIWSASMDEPVVVDKYCSSMDIIPTVYNLFGIKYDSRLLMGIDVMSDAPGLVILNTHATSWNWITDYGTYKTSTGTFTPHEGVNVGDEATLKKYVNNLRSIVSNKRKYSLAILDNDYYRYVFG